MAINKKLIHFQTLNNFNTQLSAGNILDTSIVFIKDAKKIWTHGQFYDCAAGGEMDNDELSEFVGRLIGYGEGEDGVFSDGYYYDGGGDSVVATIEAMDTNIHNEMMGKANASTTLDGYGITDKLFKSLGTQANIADTKGWGVFQYNSTTAGAPSNYGSIIQWVNPTNYDSKPSVNGWYTQLFSATDNGGLSYRTATNGYGWKSWVKLVDSSNIGSHLKTINGQSIVGSGDITIEGGSGGGSGSPAYPVVNHDASDNTLYLTPNTLHIWDEVGTLDLSLGDETAGVANEYLFEFKSGAEATTLSLPNDIKFTEDLVIEANKIYQVSILNNLASVLSWDNASDNVQLISFSCLIDSLQAEVGMTWTEWVNSSYNNGKYAPEGDNIVRNGNSYVAYQDAPINGTDTIIKDAFYNTILI